MRTSLSWILGFCLLAACGDDDSSADDTNGDTAAADDDDDDAADTDTGSGTEGPGTAGSGTAAADTADSTAGGVCTDEFPAIVSDIDETLTLSDAEFFMQLEDGNYDPVEREGGPAMINQYADLGYRILYLTARSETLTTAVTDETAREATERWLDEHGFPNDEANTRLILAESVVFGEAARMYKAEALMELQAEGWVFEYAYGNADSDIGAYEDAGIDKATTFIIGEEAGNEGTVAIEGEDWLGHSARHLPTVPGVCEVGG